MDPYYNPLSAIDSMSGPSTPTTQSPRSLTGGSLRHIRERFNVFKTPPKQQSNTMQHGIRRSGSPPPRVGSREMMSVDRILNAELYSPTKDRDFVMIEDDEICPVDYSSGYDADDECQSSPEKENSKGYPFMPCLPSFWTTASKPKGDKCNSVPSVDPFASQAGPTIHEPVNRRMYTMLFGQLEAGGSKNARTNSGRVNIDQSTECSSGDDLAEIISKMMARRDNTLQVTTKRPIFQPPPPMSDGTEEDSATMTDGSHTMVASSSQGDEGQDVEGDWSIVDDEEAFESGLCIDDDFEICEYDGPIVSNLEDLEDQKVHDRDYDEEDFDFCDRHDDKRQKIEDTESSYVHLARQMPYKVNPLYMAKYGSFSFPSTVMA